VSIGEDAMQVAMEIARARDMALMFSEMGDFEAVLRHSAAPAATWEPLAVYARIEALQALGRHEAAMELCELALCQLEADPQLLSRAGYVYGSVGNWEKLFLINALVIRGIDIRPDIPKWQGEPLDGKHVLVFCHLPGHGDHIMYARFIADLARTGAQITIQCREELVRLFSRLPGVGNVVDFDAMPICDFKTVIVEIPHFLGIKTDGIPADPYLFGSEAQRQPSPLKVGITWGCKADINRMKRACRLAELAPLAAVPGIKLYSLEKGPARKDLSPITGVDVVDLADQLGDFADTADAIASLDAVVAVDSAVANLAGAMGKPLFVLTPFFTDSRWAGDAGSLWYPSAKVYKQTEEGEWAEPISRLTSDLTQWALNNS
jgi:hypothetical protein